MSTRYGKTPNIRSDKELARFVAWIGSCCNEFAGCGLDWIDVKTLKTDGYGILSRRMKIALHAACTPAMQRNGLSWFPLP
jgi:hypothetical protein